MTSEEREQLMRHSPQRCRPGESTSAADAGDEGHTSTARALTLKEYAALVKRKRCRWCRRKLSSWVEHYDHAGGWEVSGFSQKQWLYTTCPKCKYQWNLGKLGIAK
jgi:hypothetical protein